ncbi:MAG: hypothetical protein K0B11_22715 [Mariniphaga sp.]|nr:hypothetical protein [Mariniphaga sp.]
MKAIVLFSSFFFFLGLKIGNIIDLPGKAKAAVEVGITEKIKQSAPVKSFHLFKEQGDDVENQGVNPTAAGDKTSESKGDSEE